MIVNKITINTNYKMNQYKPAFFANTEASFESPITKDEQSIIKKWTIFWGVLFAGIGLFILPTKGTNEEVIKKLLTRNLALSIAFGIAGAMLGKSMGKDAVNGRKILQNGTFSPQNNTVQNGSKQAKKD